MKSAKIAAVSGVSVVLLALLPGCGLFAMQRDFDALKAKDAQMAKDLDASRQELVTMRSELNATRERLDNALRANADTGSDILSSKARINDVAGRTDELVHGLDQLRKDLQSSRTELDTKIDELKRAQSVQSTPPPPPVQIPADKGAHFQALQTAYNQKDWGLVRTLGHEYVNRYGADDRADDALYLIGSGDMLDNRPASALGEYNKLLKLYPRSDKLDRTLYDMGEAYLMLHDCANAKLAFGACEQRFPREKVGLESKAKIAAIERPSPGMCAPQP
jgi:TolA-binding protein